MLIVDHRNFAGIIGPLAMTWDTDLTQWRKVIEINTIGLFICNKHELKQMLKQESIEVYIYSKSRKIDLADYCTARKDDRHSEVRSLTAHQ